MTTVIDLAETYLLLDGPDVVTVGGGDEFWAKLDSDAGFEAQIDPAWLIGTYRYTTDFATWEMHPEADEIVHVLTGTMNLTIETTSGLRHETVPAGKTIVIPAGAWHTADIPEPVSALHITLGRGTTHRARA